MNKIKTVILGCGSVAGNNFDLNCSLNHAKEIKNNKNFKLIACIEKIKDKKLRFQRKYKIPFSYNSFKSFTKSKLKYDLIVVTTNSELHYNNLIELSNHTPKNILCEKPICKTKKELETLNKIIKLNNINFFVNFNRKEDKAIKNLKKTLRKNIFGNIQHVRCIYGNGILNNGIHMIDLLFYLFKNLKLKKVTKSKKYKNKISPSFVLESNDKFLIYVDALKYNKFSMFEMDIILQNGRIKYNDNGLKIETYKVEKNKYFTNKYKLTNKPKIIKTQFLASFKNVYKNIGKKILNNQYNLEIDKYNKVHKLCYEIINKS